MKKLVVSAAVMLIAAAFITSCGPRQLGGQIKGDSYVTEGWVNNDTFRVTATSAPKAGLTNKTQRRATAKESAIMMAQKTMIEKFKGARLEGASGSADAASTGIAIMKEFSGTVKGGSVIRETYNDEDDCEIIYELIAPGLKKKVMGGVQ